MHPTHERRTFALGKETLANGRTRMSVRTCCVIVGVRRYPADFAKSAFCLRSISSGATSSM
jgi:hypothetical protein